MDDTQLQAHVHGIIKTPLEVGIERTLRMFEAEV
jgi:hypothetical protein